MAEGYRVLRGPDWSQGDFDGGEGHLGTVVEECRDGQVEVIWDNGNRGVCRAGQDGKFDLRVVDTAPAGVHHKGEECVCCGTVNFFGAKWTCCSCKKCIMCNECYVGDKHDISHEFHRQDYPNSPSVKVKKRAASLKIQTMGIFPCAIVTRGPHWQSGDVDGGKGQGCVETLGKDPKDGIARCIAKVTWPSGRTSLCRVGHLGRIDLQCVDVAPGSHCYRDHIPNLDLRAVKKPEKLQNTAPKAPAPVSVPEPHEEAKMQVGDRVCIGLSLDQLKATQSERGAWSVGMGKCLGKVGTVKSFAPNGDVTVEFDELRFRLYPGTLKVIPALKVGDVVRIESDEQKVKAMQEGHGEWVSDMKLALGKVGKVVKKDSDGDVVVAFVSRTFLFNPACCTLAPGAREDTIAAVSENPRPSTASSTSSTGSTGSSGSSFSSDGSGSTGADLHRDLLNLLGGLLLREFGGSVSPDALYKAIGDGNASAVKVMVDKNRQLVNIIHHGVTPLILASHEGHLDIVKVLLGSGANLESKDHQGNTALTAALIGKEGGVANFLLERGARVDVVVKTRNPLHLASFANVADVIAPLIQRGCDVNARDGAGDTPLHDAVEKGNNSVIAILVRAAKLDLALSNKKGFNPLQLACLKGNAVATELIVKRNKAVTDLQKEDGFGAIHIAAINGHSDCIDKLVVHGGARLELKSGGSLTALHLACIRMRQSAIQTLVKHKADVNAKTDKGHTPLHLLLNASSESSDVEDLFAALLGASNSREETQARLACFLLDNGAIVNPLDSSGRTPLDVCNNEAVKNAVTRYVRSKPTGVIKYRQGGAQGAMSGGGGGRGGLTLTLAVCKVCEEDMATITALPCDHRALCRDCALRVNRCPQCNTLIQRRVHKRGDDVPCKVQ